LAVDWSFLILAPYRSARPRKFQEIAAEQPSRRPAPYSFFDSAPTRRESFFRQKKGQATTAFLWNMTDEYILSPNDAGLTDS
jgi:hypothetical protein